MAGDFSVIIVWEDRKSNLQVAILDHLMPRIRELQVNFSRLKFMHIYRQFNLEADTLSKCTIGLMEDNLYYGEYQDHHVISKGTLQAY